MEQICVACKLTPLTGGPLIDVRWVTPMPEMGGLKGETAPGDAHPYLAPFYVIGAVSLDT